MSIHDKPYIVGIDLGTTNSAVSYIELGKDRFEKPQIKIYRIAQCTGTGEFSPLSVLPSFLYIPGEYDIPKDAVSIPWRQGRPGAESGFVGAFARDYGVKVPSRLVSSAKSWLCNAYVDRQAKILPWGAGGDVCKVSPVQATAAYLEHIKNAWNSAKGDEEERHLENQTVIVTVPASFDEVARDLTLEAASLAGIGQITLIEEPLAAFYNWLADHEETWHRFVKKDELIFICDVGGGTTDFTLITLKEIGGAPRFERIAVGDHLILGGDNIDLALAKHVESQVEKQHVRLTTDRWRTLCHQCRQAKETLLGRDTESWRVTLAGEGSRLIAGTLSVELRRQIVEDIVLDRFFPLVSPEAGLMPLSRNIHAEFGLPYENETAVTRHIVEFLNRHREDGEKLMGRTDCRPDLILFNGGSLKPAIIQERIRKAVRHWFKIEDQNLPTVLENPNLELSVALGAAYYGLVKLGQGVKVGSGSARSYFLGIDRVSDAQGQPAKKEAVCLVERGLEEGTGIELPGDNFEVLANQPVVFDMYSSSFRSGDRCGDLVAVDDSLTPLPPIQTVIQYGKKGVKTKIPVKVEGEYSEVGTLLLWCRSLASDHRWQLRFQLRKTQAIQDVSETEVFESTVLDQARSLLRNRFENQSESDAPETLLRDITKAVERPKDQWPLGFIRGLCDELLALASARTLSPEHESRWLNLTGFCMRPGFGDGFDPHRIKALWKIYLSGPVHSRQAQVISEWWILWRRVAGGLTSGQQRQFVQDISPLLSGRGEKKPKIPPQEKLELWMALANMERLFAKEKVRWGGVLLSEIHPKKYRPPYLWSLSRIGARQPLYGPLDRVIPPEGVSPWVDTILSLHWRNPKPVAAALAQLARRTGDRTRDMDDALIKRIIDWMPKEDVYRPHLKFLTDIVSMEKQEESAIFGESLPAGLLLRGF